LLSCQRHSAANIAAVTIDFFTVIFGFVTALDVIMLQPIEAPERPPPHRQAAEKLLPFKRRA
jgi:hypothetical protein